MATTLNISVNGQSVTTFTLTFNNPPAAVVSITPTMASPVLVGNITAQINSAYNGILTTGDLFA